MLFTGTRVRLRMLFSRFSNYYALRNRNFVLKYTYLYVICSVERRIIEFGLPHLNWPSTLDWPVTLILVILGWLLRDRRSHCRINVYKLFKFHIIALVLLRNRTQDATLRTRSIIFSVSCWVYDLLLMFILCLSSSLYKFRLSKQHQPSCSVWYRSN